MRLATSPNIRLRRQHALNQGRATITITRDVDDFGDRKFSYQDNAKNRKQPYTCGMNAPHQKKGLLIYRINRDDASNTGVIKKFLAQTAAFRAIGMEVDLVCPIN